MNLENKKQAGTFLLAIGLGLVATFLASQYIRNSIEQNTRVYREEFEKKAIIPMVNEMDAMKRELQRVQSQQQALAQKQQEQPAVVAKPAQGGIVPTFSLKTPPGKRAFTMMIDSLSAVGGLINPGDRVDVLGHLTVPNPDDPKGGSKKITSILFQNIQILAVGINFAPVDNAEVYASQQRARTLHVTFALSPEEVGLLTFAQAHGSLQLTLRSPQEQETESLEVAAWDTLSEYVFQRQGTELVVPRERTSIHAVDERGIPSGREVKPFIQIFKGGQKL